MAHATEGSVPRIFGPFAQVTRTGDPSSDNLGVAAPKVEMHTGQQVTNIAPDFSAKRWLGFSGRIAAHPFLPICRCQIDVSFDADSRLVAERMPGFHWMMVYGDYLREAGYALKRIRTASIWS